MKKIIAALVISLAYSAPAAAETGIENLPGNALKRTGAVFTSPLRMRQSDGFWVAGLAGCGYLIYTADGGIRRVFKRSDSPLNDLAGDTLEKLGDGGYELGFLGLYGAAGHFLKKPEMTTTALLAAESFVAASAVGLAVKLAAGRARPNRQQGRGIFRPFKANDNHASFPSGHSLSAFSVASVFAARSESPVAGAIAYSLAAGVALQRLYDDRHWASDVFMGAVLGTVVGRAVTAGDRAGEKKTAYLLPVFAPGYSGARAVFMF